MVRMTEVEMANVQIVCALSAILRIRDIAPLCTLTLRLKRRQRELFFASGAHATLSSFTSCFVLQVYNFAIESEPNTPLAAVHEDPRACGLRLIGGSEESFSKIVTCKACKRRTNEGFLSACRPPAVGLRCDILHEVMVTQR